MIKPILYSICIMLTLAVQAAAPVQQTLPALAKPFAAPEFELKGEDGKSYRLSDYRGKLVILAFWATWCPPCRFEMPSLERAWQKLKHKNIIVLGVNVGEDADTIFEFTGNFPMSFPIPMDLKGEVVKKYPVVGLPTSYIISPNGKVTHRAVGSREWDKPDILSRLLHMSQTR